MAGSNKLHEELAALFSKANGGDAGCYASFLRSITPILRLAVAKKVPVVDVEDVLQETLISVHKARHTFDGNRPVMPWLFAIAHYRICDYLRKSYTKGIGRTVDIAELSDVLADVTIVSPDDESISKLLENTSQRGRQILTLMHVEGFTAKETGAQLGMNESAVKVAAHRAMKKIREAFGT
ncbi:MAG: sigma-70 family RNA polymerase sigma factor [Bdellovibrionales bacterium]